MGLKDDDEMRDTKFSKHSGPPMRKQQMSSKNLIADAKKEGSFVGMSDLERLQSKLKKFYERM